MLAAYRMKNPSLGCCFIQYKVIMKPLTLAIVATISTSVCAQDAPRSYLPKTELSKYIFEKLDITTFRSSLGPLRTFGQRHIAELGLTATKQAKNLLAIETKDWLYEFEIIRVADVNGDGLVDIEVCFRDKAKMASYNTQEPLLLSQFEKDGPLIAINFQVDGCEEYAL